MNSLRAAFDELASDVPEYGDVDRAIEQAESERRRRNAWVAGIATAAVLAVVLGMVAITREGPGTQEPIDPLTPSPTPSGTVPPAQWPGAVRPGTSWPVVSEKRLGPPADPWRGLTDNRDAGIGQIDIRVLSGRRLAGVGCASPCWILSLRADPPRENLHATDPVIEYGAIVDTDGDRVGDCQLALTTDAPGGEYRAWLRNLRTGATEEQIGPPFGYPFDFSLLSKSDEERKSAVFLYFLNGLWQKPCERPDGPSRWYAYASLTEDGQVTAWDFAPDAAWLEDDVERP